MRFFDVFEHLSELIFALDAADRPVYLNKSASAYAAAHGTEALLALAAALRHSGQEELRCPGADGDFLVSSLPFSSGDGKTQLLYKALQLTKLKPAPTADHAAALLEKVVPLDSPSAALYATLQDLGERFALAAAWLYVVEHRTVTTTITWTRTISFSAENNLNQGDAGTLLKSYIEQLLLDNQNCSLFIPRVDALKQEHPLEYALLNEFNLTNVLILPLSSSESAAPAGFLLLCSVAEAKLPDLKKELPFYQMVLSSLIKKRHILTRLLRLKERDDLTEAYNRRAFERYEQSFRFHKSLGVILVQLNDSAQLNERYGTRYTDDLLKKTFQCLKTVLIGFPIYRTLGLTFTAVLKDVRREQLELLCTRAQAMLKSQNCAVTLNSAFTDSPCSLSEFMHRLALSGRNADKNALSSNNEQQKLQRDFDELPEHPFFYYVEHYRFDELALLQSLSSPGQNFGIYFGDLTQNVFYLGDNLCELFGFAHNIENDFFNRWRSLICDERDRELWEEDMARTLKDPQHNHSIRYRVATTEGGSIWVHCRGKVIFDKDQKPLFMSGSILRLDDRNLIDSLSNLPRSYAAIKQINRLIEQEHSCTVLAFKLHYFPEINEQLGHETANQLLRATADSLVKRVGELLDFYRMEGTTFIAVSKTRDLDTENQLKELIIRTITRCYHDFGFKSLNCAAITSIRYPDHISHAEDLFEKLSFFVLTSKQTTETFIDLSVFDVQSQRRQASFVLQLTSAVANNFDGFSTVVQPLVHSKNRRIAGAEMLLRWSDSNLNIGPTAFIPVLEKTKLIVPVGRFVFEQAAAFVKKALKYQPDFFITINVSYVQVREDPEFFSFIESTLNKLHLAGSHFMLELTETNFDSDPNKLQTFVDNCHQTGIRLALDDFGNGYSSINLLLKYPATLIKLDRTLTLKVNESLNNLNFIKAVISACHQFGRQVCVEGVETRQELDSILQTDCDLIQGYYFYRPLKQADLLAQLLLQQSTAES